MCCLRFLAEIPSASLKLSFNFGVGKVEIVCLSLGKFFEVEGLESARKGDSGDHEGRPYAIREESKYISIAPFVD